MVELNLIVALAALGLGAALSVARWLMQQPSGESGTVRVAGLVADGVGAFLRRQDGIAAALSGVVGALVLVAYGAAFQLDAVKAVAPRSFGLWSTGAFILGALAAIAAVRAASWSGRASLSRVAAGAVRSIDEALQIGLRAGAISGAVALSLAVLGLALLIVAVSLVEGWPDTKTLTALPLRLAGFVLGASVMAMFFQLGGGIYGKVADVGADVAGKLEASLQEDAVENPATVADLVGDSVGDGAGRAAALLASIATECLGAMLVAAMVLRDTEEAATFGLASATAVVLFPLVLRTFGTVAAWFGVMVVRTDDREFPMSALSRGMYVTALLYGVAAFGCAKWLLGSAWPWLGGAAALGSAASVALLHAEQYYSEQRARPVRSLAEAARGGATLATLRGALTAAEGTLASAGLTSLTIFIAYRLGAASGLAHGGLFGVALACGGFLGVAPYARAMEGLGAIVDAAGGVVALSVAEERPDVRERARVLDAVGTTAKTYAKVSVGIASSLACFVVAAAFVVEVWSRRGAAPVAVDATNPVLYLAATFGVMLVVAFVWATLWRVLRASRELVHELRGQLAVRDDDAASLAISLRPGGLAPRRPRGVDDLADDDDDDPSDALRRGEDRQLACVELVSRAALRSMVAPGLVGLGLPLFAGAGLRIATAGDNVGAAAEALVAFLLVAITAGAFGSLLYIHAGGAWDNAKKYIETGAHGGRTIAGPGSPRRRGGEPAEDDSSVDERDNPTYVAAVISDTIGDPFKGVVGPATLALVRALAALALVFLPFFL